MNVLNSYLPFEARIVDRVQESGTIFTLRLAFTEESKRNEYRFEPGQFNMVYLPQVGEIPLSIVSDPANINTFAHTIRAVGRVSVGLSKLAIGTRVGIRGPYGRGWPLTRALGRDVAVITGGLGCAPVVSVVDYICQRRENYGRLSILQGVKLPQELIWRKRFEHWVQIPDTQVYLASDQGDSSWPWHVGRVTDLFDQMNMRADTLVMMCGPEGMMQACVAQLLTRGLQKAEIFLSLERSMKCALGHCGHCQFGPAFICRSGPVFALDQIDFFFGKTGF